MVGPLFVSPHEMTEQQYQDLFGAIDKMAERIRPLATRRRRASPTMPHSATAEAHGSNFSAEQMVSAHQRTRDRFCAGPGRGGGREDLRDVATADMLTERLQVHERPSGMLRATVAS